MSTELRQHSGQDSLQNAATELLCLSKTLHSALMGCTEHMEWPTGPGRIACNAAGSAIVQANSTLFSLEKVVLGKKVELASERAISMICAMKKSGLFVVLPDNKLELKERVRSLLKLLAFEDALADAPNAETFDLCVDEVTHWLESNSSNV